MKRKRQKDFKERRIEEIGDMRGRKRRRNKEERAQSMKEKDKERR
jgi:hypothetical protein